ncbi:MAG: aldo/keto reductase [Planctomycetes bacterium]|nr:aldo/keto reductase [Planctomycetota bacterium]
MAPPGHRPSPLGETGYVVQRRLGTTDLELSPLGFGAFKIGRNQGIKYEQAYELPSESEVERLLNAVLDAGVNYIDTAPAYGLSEQRIGDALADRTTAFILSTKVGERFEDGQSTYDYSESGVRESIDRSCERLKVDVLDLVFVHSHGEDMRILNETDVVGTLRSLREAGRIRAIGFSGKTVEGARIALHWADAIMVEYHLDDQSHAEVIAEANTMNIGVVVKKGLASGRLDPRKSIEFVLSNPGVTSLIIGGLNLEHVTANLETARRIKPHQ